MLGAVIAACQSTTIREKLHLKLEELKPGAIVSGISPDGPVTVVAVTPMGEHAVTVFFKADNGLPQERMLFRADEERLSSTVAGRPWAFDADADDFRLATEAMRIHLAHLFDPMMAVHTSNVEPLPHQISAVYESMLPRQPLRFVLADDPGAGKTIMAGLLIRELIMRSDAHRILIVAPGSLAVQWQEEMHEKFDLDFEIFSRERQESAPSGNYFQEQNQLIARLDQVARNDDYIEKLRQTNWDLIVVDEAHKMSATFTGREIKKTQRFELGEILAGLCRHFLLMTATPHNGKDDDFQLFLSLLDGDRFYGKPRGQSRDMDVSDLMRRMVKEKLVTFEGKPLFPERFAYTASYRLSAPESELYDAVTDYVRNEMNRADRLGGSRKGTVGFALTQLQRRLASSPEAIYQSLRRRHERLEKKLQEARRFAAGRPTREEAELYTSRTIDLPASLDDAEDELSAEDYEAWADQVIDEATASETIPEFEAEITILRHLEAQARAIVRSRNDSKWTQLSHLLQETPEMYDASGRRRKLIVFTEHRDTLNYLKARIGDVLGSEDAIVIIHGGVKRDDRRKAQELFRHDPEVQVLLATDAAGEGVNLQNANLMVNYDLPWNPNRLEQRFGRIHRIGQREVCHLWNLVAEGTREGDVFKRLLDKLEIERQALGGQVFDILGEAFENHSLKDLLMEAIRYGESPEVRQRLDRVIDGALDTRHLNDIIRRNALVDTAMTLEQLFAVKEQMDKAQARKLQPYFLRGFFVEAFARKGGECRQREGRRYEIPHVPASLREIDRRSSDNRTPVLKRYERICFDKSEIHVRGKPDADLVHPAHPLMAALIRSTLGELRPVLKRGAVMLDPADPGTEPALLLMILHSVREADPAQPPLSQRLQFVLVDAAGNTRTADVAPHLGLESLPDDLHQHAASLLQQSWLDPELEARAMAHAAQNIVPEHYREVAERRLRQVSKTRAAVQQRLTREINYLSGRAAELDVDVEAGKQPRVQPENLRRRAEELAERLERRNRELERMGNVVSATPLVIGGALIIPAGLVAQWQGKQPSASASVDAAARARIEHMAMQAVIQAERARGCEISDVSAQKCGWDVTSWPPIHDGELSEPRHIEVKGRAKGNEVVTVSRNEICTALNQGNKFWLAIVLVEGNQTEGPYYVQKPFTQEPEPGVASANYRIADLCKRATVQSGTDNTGG